ncbi:type 1 fimbrial protein [Ignatzschineria rhizosphaerae]|uniref:Type 1 fimbrial protein n=1 Tax=Ignatzschineria rhizosphaerae TaxID=2923279 RepID=A0ABY3X092_9GAMM|nr:fimbrial protein [Ignatzschineria rhizosphaerae]UNM96297.1 type 1 fimbrial protein [Ignatzschineria rhizosphaerae]
MKKMTLTLALIAATTSAVFAQAMNTINFKGTVTDSACTLNSVEDVDLGSIAVNTLKNGKTGGWGSSEIIFTDCNLDAEEGAAKDKIVLSVLPGTAADSGNKYWFNEGDASNVGVEIQISNTAITPDGKSEIPQLAISGNTVKTTVRGRTVKSGSGDPSVGSVSARINFVADYR